MSAVITVHICLRDTFKGTVQHDGSGWKYAHSKGLYKREGRESLQKNSPIPHPERASERDSATSYSCWFFENKLLMAHTALSAAFYSLHTAVGNGARNKFWICFQTRKEHFKLRMLLFSVGNGAMNATRNRQWRNECFAMLATAWWDQCEYTSLL